MILYTVVRDGVYRHEILGIFSTPEKAKHCAYEACKGDSDDYHTYLILQGKLDVGVSDLTKFGRYTRWDRARNSEGYMVYNSEKLLTP